MVAAAISFVCCLCLTLNPLSRDCLVGLVVRSPPRERKIPGSKPAYAGIFSGSSHISDLKIGTSVATLPGVIGSAQGLVGGLYYDWARWKV